MSIPRPSLDVLRARCCDAGLISVALAWAVSVSAQTQFDELRKRALPGAVDGSWAEALGDVDGDGDLDLAIGNYVQNQLFVNDGTGIYTDVTADRLPVDDGATALALGDVDGDGDLDMVLGRYGQNRLLLNDGTGRFTDATQSGMPHVSDATLSIAFDDVDGDGDLDMFVGNYGQPNKLHLNDGSGRYSDVTTTRLPTVSDPTHAVALGDVDGDGDVDVVFGNYGNRNSGQTRLCLNDGLGRFTEAPPGHLPATRYTATGAVALGDLDGDGDLDLVLGGQHVDQLFVNDGTGRYTDRTTGRMPVHSGHPSAVAFGDVDGDGDLDLIAVDDVLSPDGRDRLYVNDGSGTFADATSRRMPIVGNGVDVDTVALGDVDGDGDLDIVPGNRLYLNDGAGTYSDATAGRLPDRSGGTTALVLGDVDGDGDLDVVIGSGESWRDRLYLNDGGGAYVDASGRLPAGNHDTGSVAVGDVDGDGDNDLVLGVRDGGLNRLYLNDGAGHFTDATVGRLPAISGSSHAVALGDVDRDGDLDLVVGNGRFFRGVGAQNRLYLNDGSGVFTDATAASLPPFIDDTYALGLGDVDGDGDLDIVFGNAGGHDRLYRNDGSGGFTEVTAAQLPARTDDTRAVVLGDVDRDGDLDLLTGINGYGGGQNRLYRNDGTGTFTDHTATNMPAVDDATFALALGDVDGDGDLDLLVGNGGYPLETNRLCLNDGTGAFAHPTTARLPGHRERTTAVALGDVDGDGDLDAVVGNFENFQRDRLYLNLLRQLDAPFVPRIGQTFTLDAFARYGAPRVVDIALPFVSMVPAAIPLGSLGTLGLDPAHMVALPPFLVPQPAGVGSVSIRLPNAPSLVGSSIHAQALLVPYPRSPLLSNVTSDVVLR